MQLKIVIFKNQEVKIFKLTNNVCHISGGAKHLAFDKVSINKCWDQELQFRGHIAETSFNYDSQVELWNTILVKIL